MSYVEFERVGKIGIIRLNRPERMNALGTQMLDELRQAYRELEGDPALAVGIITGNGRAFCAGRDIKEGAETGASLREQATTKNTDLYMECNVGKPLISAVNGYAGGAGFYLATRAVDLVIAAESASFQIAEVPRGILHGWQTGYWLNLPRAAARELAFGFRLSGTRAYQVGLANEVCADGDLMAVAMARAEHIAAMPSAVISYNRDLARKLENVIEPGLAEVGRQLYLELLSQGNADEGDRAFLEKHEAEFSR